MADSKLCQESVSVIIPTLNGGRTLEKLLSMLKVQTLVPDEILICDSGSEDDTVQICHKHSLEPIYINKSEFDHGGTRSMLAQKARGSVLVFFTQDAIPGSVDALEKLVTPLREHENVCCSYGRQLPRTDASLTAAHLRSFNYPPESEIRSFSDRDQFGLKTVFISNSFAAYSREALETVGYFKNGLIFGEDTCTLGMLLQAGYSVAYVAEACVFHSHNYSWVQDFRRSFDNGVLHSSEEWLLQTFGGAEKIGFRYIQSQLSDMLKKGSAMSIPGFLLRAAAKFSGYKLGRLYQHIPFYLLPHFSMNRDWWRKNRTQETNN